MEKFISELKNIALARPLDFLNWNDGKLELKELNEIPRRSRGAIAKIERNATGVKVVFYDKLKAIELLLRLDQLQAPAEENNLLQAIVDSTRDRLPGLFTMEELEEYAKDDNGIFIAEGN